MVQLFSLRRLSICQRHRRNSARVYSVPAAEDVDAADAASSSTPSTSGGYGDFHADLAHCLAELAAAAALGAAHSSAPASSGLTLTWLSTAVASLLSTQASLQQVLARQRRCARREVSSLDPHAAMEQHLHDSVRLLDMCKLLRDIIQQHVRATAALQLALSHLHSATTCHPFSASSRVRRAKNALSYALVRCTTTNVGPAQSNSPTNRTKDSRLTTNCTSTLIRTILAQYKLTTTSASALDPNSPSELPLSIYGNHASILLVFTVLASTLSCNDDPSIKRRLSRSRKIPGQPLWEAPLLGLHDKLRRQLRSERPAYPNYKATKGIIPGLHSLEASIASLHQMLSSTSTTEYGHSHDAHSLDLNIEEMAFVDLVQSATKSVHELHASLSKLQEQMDSLFRALLGTRMALLDLLHHTRI